MIGGFQIGAHITSIVIVVVIFLVFSKFVKNIKGLLIACLLLGILVNIVLPRFM